MDKIDMDIAYREQWEANGKVLDALFAVVEIAQGTLDKFTHQDRIRDGFIEELQRRTEAVVTAAADANRLRERANSE